MFNQLNNQLSNMSVLQRITNRSIERGTNALSELRMLAPQLSDDLLKEVYQKSISLHQRNAQGNGYFLENNIIKDFLDSEDLKYKTQVTIDKEGIIVGFNHKKNRCYHNLDFVVGEDISVDRSIRDFKVLSCKTTCRERWTQDDWSHQIPPSKYILITTSNDYPSSKRFRESENRKIITCKPKKRDDRIYKLGFEDLLGEIS